MTRLIVNLSAVLMGIFGWIISLTSIFRTGLGWDSVFDLNAAKISFENSRILNLNQYYELVPLTSEFYGTLVYKIANWLSIQFTAKSIFDNPLLLTNFYFVDLTTWFISLLSILLICISLYLTFESWNNSFLYFGMISALPIWVGMSQVNSKDIPVAAGLSILSSGFMLILKKNSSRIIFYLGILLTSIGSGISLSVRPGSVTIVLSFLLLNTIIIFLIKLKDSKLVPILLDIFLINFITLIISITILYISNNIYFFNLDSWIIDSVKVSLNFPSIQPIRVLGRDFLSNDLPAWYVIAWVWAQLPLLTFISLLLGLTLVLKQIVIQRSFYLAYSLAPFFHTSSFCSFDNSLHPSKFV